MITKYNIYSHIINTSRGFPLVFFYVVLLTYITDKQNKKFSRKFIVMLYIKLGTVRAEHPWLSKAHTLLDKLQDNLLKLTCQYSHGERTCRQSRSQFEQQAQRGTNTTRARNKEHRTLFCPQKSRSIHPPQSP